MQSEPRPSASQGDTSARPPAVVPAAAQSQAGEPASPSGCRGMESVLLVPAEGVIQLLADRVPAVAENFPGFVAAVIEIQVAQAGHVPGKRRRLTAQVGDG